MAYKRLSVVLAAIPQKKLIDHLLDHYRADDNGCLEWTGKINPFGYGVTKIYLGRKDGIPKGEWKWSNYAFAYVNVHRLAHYLFNGEDDPVRHTHHTCENKRCWNPAHLQSATPRENAMASDTPARRNSRKTHCPHGHEYTPENTLISGGRRRCRECGRKACLAYYYEMRAVQ